MAATTPSWVAELNGLSRLFRAAGEHFDLRSVAICDNGEPQWPIVFPESSDDDGDRLGLPYGALKGLLPEVLPGMDGVFPIILNGSDCSVPSRRFIYLDGECWQLVLYWGPSCESAIDWRADGKRHYDAARQAARLAADRFETLERQAANCLTGAGLWFDDELTALEPGRPQGRPWMMRLFRSRTSEPARARGVRIRVVPNLFTWSAIELERIGLEWSDSTADLHLENAPVVVSEAKYSAVHIAKLLNLPIELVRKRLERSRLTHPNGFVEVENSKGRSPRFLYSLAVARAVLNTPMAGPE